MKIELSTAENYLDVYLEQLSNRLSKMFKNQLIGEQEIIHYAVDRIELKQITNTLVQLQVYQQSRLKRVKDSPVINLHIDIYLEIVVFKLIRNIWIIEKQFI